MTITTTLLASGVARTITYVHAVNNLGDGRAEIVFAPHVNGKIQSKKRERKIVDLANIMLMSLNTVLKNSVVVLRNDTYVVSSTAKEESSFDENGFIVLGATAYNPACFTVSAIEAAAAGDAAGAEDGDGDDDGQQQEAQQEDAPAAPAKTTRAPRGKTATAAAAPAKEDEAAKPRGGRRAAAAATAAAAEAPAKPARTARGKAAPEAAAEAPAAAPARRARGAAAAAPAAAEAPAAPARGRSRAARTEAGSWQ